MVSAACVKVETLIWLSLQRSDEMRRYAFGVMHVINETAPFEVEGAWLLRGQVRSRCCKTVIYFIARSLTGHRPDAGRQP
jgi:hypothetical protein